MPILIFFFYCIVPVISYNIHTTKKHIVSQNVKIMINHPDFQIIWSFHCTEGMINIFTTSIIVQQYQNMYSKYIIILGFHMYHKSWFSYIFFVEFVVDIWRCCHIYFIEWKAMKLRISYWEFVNKCFHMFIQMNMIDFTNFHWFMLISLLSHTFHSRTIFVTHLFFFF